MLLYTTANKESIDDIDSFFGAENIIFIAPKQKYDLYTISELSPDIEDLDDYRNKRISSKQFFKNYHYKLKSSGKLFILLLLISLNAERNIILMDQKKYHKTEYLEYLVDYIYNSYGYKGYYINKINDLEYHMKSSTFSDEGLTKIALSIEMYKLDLEEMVEEGISRILKFTAQEKLNNQIFNEGGI